MSRFLIVSALLIGALPALAQSPGIVQTMAVPGLGDYAYDGSGNIIQAGPRTYLYDRFGRLSAVDHGNLTEQAYTYDRHGNLLTITTSSVNASHVTTNHTTRLGVNPTTNRIDQNSTNGVANNMVATYDAFGNVTWSPTGTFQHDPFNIPKESTVGGVRTLYVYSASDERVASIHPALAKEFWTIRDPEGRVLRRMDRTAGSWSWSQDYIYGAGRLIASAIPNSAKVLHYHADHLGTPRLITGNGGAQVGRHDYYPFGLEIPGGTNDGERLKFTGHERDAATLDYMHARYYDASMGRFLSADPSTKYDLHHPQTWNRYAYAHNNPLLKVDPDGRDALAVTYVGYRVQTPFGRRPLGHSGITIIQGSGRTSHYEFGRYRPGGEVRRLGVPDLVMKNGVPTRDSLKAHMAALSAKAGQGLPVSGAYFTNDTAAQMQAFAEERKLDSSKQGTYGLLTNNCATFCEDVLSAGGEKLDVALKNTPENVMEELQDRADFTVHYDPKKDELKVTCREGAACPP